MCFKTVSMYHTPSSNINMLFIFSSQSSLSLGAITLDSTLVLMLLNRRTLLSLNGFPLVKLRAAACAFLTQ
jgi:hypothetical protein